MINIFANVVFNFIYKVYWFLSNVYFIKYLLKYFVCLFVLLPILESVQERERQRNIRVRETGPSATICTCSDWDRTCGLGMCSDPEWHQDLLVHHGTMFQPTDHTRLSLNFKHILFFLSLLFHFIFYFL